MAELTTAFVRRHFTRGPIAYFEDGEPVRMPTADEIRLSGEQFDRWLAEEIRKAKRSAWFEGISAAVNVDLGEHEVAPDVPLNPYLLGEAPTDVPPWCEHDKPIKMCGECVPAPASDGADT